MRFLFSFLLLSFLLIFPGVTAPTEPWLYEGRELGHPLSSRKAEPYVLSLEATAYTHTGKRTFTETWPKVGTVAVDPEYIPLGTRLYVEGYGEAVAEDTGRLIKGWKIDLFMETREEALQFGRRQVRVRVLSVPEGGTIRGF